MNNGINKLKAVINSSKNVGGRLETKLEDGSKVIFRKDFGKSAHPIRPKFPNSVNHYNIEIHKPIRGQPNRFEQVYDGHIIVDSKGKVIDFLNK